MRGAVLYSRGERSSAEGDEIGPEDASGVRVPRRRPLGAYRVNERLPLAYADRRQQGLGDGAVVQDTRDLVLVSELAGLAHPAMERAVRHLDEPWRHHADVVGALCPVVGVEGGERLVELAHEDPAVPRRNAELDEPLVAAAGLAGRWVARRDRELRGLGAGSTAGDHQRLLDFLDDDVLAEGVDEVSRAPGDHEAEWIARGEADRVAEQIGPEPAGRRQRHRIGPVELDVGHRMPPRAGAPEVLRRNELVEDSIVEHERQPTGALRLEPDEAFRGRIHLDVLDRPAHPLLHGGAIRRERDAPVDERAEIRPALSQARDGPACGPARPRDALEEDQEPRGHSRDEPEVLILDPLGHSIDPLVPVRDRRDLASGRIARAEARRQVLDHEPREITPPAALPDRLQPRAPAEEQERPARDALEPGALRGDQQRVPASLSVGAKRLGGYRDHLVARGGPRGLHPVTRPARPGQVALSVDGAGPERLEAQIVSEGRAGLVVGNGADLLEPMRAPERRPARNVHEIEQRAFLDAGGVAADALERAAPMTRVDAERRAADPLDHERPPGIARRARVSTSQSPTAALNASGRSSIGAWPQLGRYTSCEPRMRAWKRSATSVGVMRSSLPQTSRVGTRIWLKRSSTLWRLAARATWSTRSAVRRVVTMRRIDSTHSGVTRDGS